MAWHFIMKFSPLIWYVFLSLPDTRNLITTLHYIYYKLFKVT